MFLYVISAQHNEKGFHKVPAFYKIFLNTFPTTKDFLSSAARKKAFSVILYCFKVSCYQVRKFVGSL